MSERCRAGGLGWVGGTMALIDSTASKSKAQAHARILWQFQTTADVFYFISVSNKSTPDSSFNYILHCIGNTDNKLQQSFLKDLASHHIAMHCLTKTN